ncbi:hypothetical protein [Arthrobacter agilis]|uniref:hypothetical protein n=1 Tax=Arthrobacter agilis TaxID=37921 RepID=UPI002786DB17|nr:hypothetical protein [Arthrobacter agilis]MDQ0736325.1 hypothetical protein [Arthrobacter agilis]
MSQDPYPGERPSTGGSADPSDSTAEGGAHGDRPYDPSQAYQQPYQQPYQQGAYPLGGYQPGYPAGGYQTGPYQSYQPSYEAMEGEKAAQLSLILGLVGLFVAGFVLGPLAIWQARKAERLGVPATAGKVLGWITTILYALAILAGILFFVILLIGLGASSTYSS